MEPPGRELAPTINRAKERSVLVAGDSGRLDVGVQVFFELVVSGHFVMLAALFEQANRPSTAAEKKSSTFMPRTAEILANENTIVAMIARSRRPTMFGSPGVPTSIESSNSRAWSASRTGVLPFLTTCFGPRTELAGFIGST